MRNLRLSEICNRITDGSHNPPKGVNNSDFLMIRKILASRHTLGLSDREVKKGYKYYEALQKKILSAFVHSFWQKYVAELNVIYETNFSNLY